MSVWQTVSACAPVLQGSDGALVSVTLTVDATDLEEALDALAQLPYPVNPQIFHDGGVITEFSDGREEIRAATVVEFPAYTCWLDEIHRVWNAYGFGDAALHVTGMLEDIHSSVQVEAAPQGAGYRKRTILKHARSATAGRA